MTDPRPRSRKRLRFRNWRGCKLGRSAETGCEKSESARDEISSKSGAKKRENLLAKGKQLPNDRKSPVKKGSEDVQEDGR